MVGLDPLCRLVPVEKWKLNVHQDHVGAMFDRGGECLFAIVDLNDLISGMRKKIAQNRSVIFLIFHHKNAFGHACPACCSTLIGTSMKNVEPLPNSDDTQMRPPCRLTMRLAIDRPSPVPLFVLVEELSTC